MTLRILFLSCLAVAAIAAPSENHGTVYRQRIEEVLAWRAGLVDRTDPKSGGLAEVAARLARREEAAWCSERVIALMQEPSGDMFWMFPCVAVAYLGRDQLTPAAREALRDTWRTYMPMRGDTENHWAMYYTSLYLMTELYPDEPGSHWFTGKSSEENRAEARDYLRHWMDLTTTKGQGEYDCTHYIGEYCIPMLYLATWAGDAEMKQRGRMMLDYLLADFAVDCLDGAYVGAHARTDDRQVLEKWNGLSAFFAWLFFQNCPPPEAYGGWGVFFAAAAHESTYELPEVIHRIATRRDEPYVHRELKRTRNRWRNSDLRHTPVYKTTYMTADYAVGSDQGGQLSPIQQHSWDVTWAVEDPRGVHNTLFSMHPMSSPAELQMYFTEFPDWLPKAVTQQGKPSYDSPDKLLGGSAYEQVFQDQDTIVALYDIAPGTRFEHINGFFSKDLARREEDASGWLFVQGGNAYIACRPLAPYRWEPYPAGGHRLVSPHLKNGMIVQVAAAREFPSWGAFKAAIRALPLRIGLEPSPRAELTSLRGRRLVCAYGETPRVDGQPVDYGAWPLFGGPYLNAAPGSRQLTLTQGTMKRVLDFATLTIHDETVGH